LKYSSEISGSSIGGQQTFAPVTDSDAAPLRKFPIREEINRVALEKVNSLVAKILPSNLFYAQKLGRKSFSPFASLLDFSHSIPFTTKHEVIKDRLASPPYGTNLTFALEAYVRCHQTSGSTNMPIRWLDTKESWERLTDNWQQIFDAAGITGSDRFFFAFSFGPFLGFWTALEAALKRGCFCLPGGGMSTLARAQAILDNSITVLCCTPTYAQHLGETIREKKMDWASNRLRLVIVAGESGGSIPATRARIEKLLPGAQVFDHHGMTEVGPVTYQCPAKPGILHVLESAYFPEVIDPQTLLPVQAGQTGELVLTTLDRVGSPLLRYRTGDLVKPISPGQCNCGRWEVGFEGGILGRSDDMVVIRGVNVYPALFEEIIRKEPGVVEYRVELGTRGAMNELQLQIEPVSDCLDADGLCRRLSETLQAALNLRIPVVPLPGGSLPRFEMKSNRWVRVNQ
jgi:phenylacetate-CoA ligase